MNKPADRIYTTKEAAERLRVHPRTVQILLKKGKLNGFRIGIDWRTTEADIQAFIEANRPKKPTRKGGRKRK